MAKFPFNDLHSFKDYVGFVKLCAPDMFPKRYGIEQEAQWTLNLAFDGLRLGVELFAVEKRQSELKDLIDDAESKYLLNDIKGGYTKLESLSILLKKFPLIKI